MLSRPVASFSFLDQFLADNSKALPGWLSVATQFIGSYSTGELDTFYQKYPSPASFPAPSVPPAGPSETEDCLFLDVMVPATVIRKQAFRNRRAPVVVWFYGGGFTVGDKTQWPPADLLQRSYGGSTEGLILVAVNYRVSASLCNYQLMR